jgi:thiol-disulfide isomerase/thioredoxin
VAGVRRNAASFLVMIVLAACVGEARERSNLGEPVAVSGELPVLEGRALSGGPLAASDVAAEAVVVNFWATWCGPCREEQPALQRVWERYEDRGLSMIGVNFRDDPAAAKEWIRSYGVTYPSLEDPAGTYGDDFPGFVGLPATYIADSTGQLRYRFFGRVEEAALARVLDEILPSK